MFSGFRPGDALDLFSLGVKLSTSEVVGTIGVKVSGTSKYSFCPSPIYLINSPYETTDAIKVGFLRVILKNSLSLPLCSRVFMLFDEIESIKKALLVLPSAAVPDLKKWPRYPRGSFWMSMESWT